MESSDVYNHQLVANLDVPCREITNIYDDDGRGCRVVTNARHWKTRDPVMMPKPAGTVRIFFVGDSYMEGMCDGRFAMPDQVGARLAAEPTLRDRGTFETINTGTSSWSTIVYKLFVERELSALAPDVIVINEDLTDVTDDVIYEKLARRGPDGEIVAVPPIGRETRREEIFAGDYVGWAREVRIPVIAEQISRSMGYLKAAVEAARKAGARVVLSTSVHRGHFPGYDSPLSHQPFDEVRAVARESGALYFDLYGAFANEFAQDPDRGFLVPRDGHYSIEGNAAWASALAAFMIAHADELFPRTAPAGSLPAP